MRSHHSTHCPLKRLIFLLSSWYFKLDFELIFALGTPTHFYHFFFQEISLNFDGLCVFLTPSQLNILKTFFAAIAKPPSNSGLFEQLGPAF